jgi:hypothetical protein
MSVAEEPLAPTTKPILTALCSYSRQDSQCRAIHISSRRCFSSRGTPPYRITFRWQWVSVAGLVPSIFGAHDLGG